MAYAHKGPGSDVFVHADPEGIKCIHCSLCFPERGDVVRVSAGEMLEHLVEHRSKGHAVPEDAMDRLAREAGIDRPGPPPLEAEMSQVITGAMIALDGQLRSLLLHGRGFARIIANNVSPKGSEVNRQAVEDAHEVLEHFNADGSLKAGADDATVLASIATMRDQAMELLRPRDLELLRQAPVAKAPMAEAVARALRSVPGVEAAFLNGKTIYVVAREHEMIDRDALLEVEEKLAPWEIEIHVRVHQGRGVESLGLGSRIV